MFIQMGGKHIWRWAIFAFAAWWLTGCQVISNPSVTPQATQTIENVSPPPSSLMPTEPPNLEEQTCKGVVLRGEIVVIGNEPFPVLVLRVNESQPETVYAIVGERKEELNEHQGAIIQACGVISTAERPSSVFVEQEINVSAYSILTP